MRHTGSQGTHAGRHRPGGGAWPARWMPAVILLAGLIMAPFAGTALGQLSDDATTSTRGTQFVRPDPPPKPAETPKPPQEAPKPDQPPAAVRPPPKQAPKPPPPRYPSVLFLVDTSDSMLNRSKDRTSTRFKEAKDAMIRVLRDMAPETRVQVWTFNRTMEPILIKGVPRGRFIPIGRGDNRQVLIQRIQGLRTQGGTNLFRSVIKALAVFDHPRDQRLYRSGQRFPVLVVVSDGEDGGKTRETMATVQKEKQKRSLVTINTIGFSISKRDGWYQELCLMASSPDGCATADDGPQLQRMLDSFYRPPERR